MKADIIARLKNESLDVPSSYAKVVNASLIESEQEEEEVVGCVHKAFYKTKVELLDALREKKSSGSSIDEEIKENVTGNLNGNDIELI